MKRPAVNQQPIDLLAQNQQLQRGDLIYSIIDERGDNNGYETADSTIPDRNRIGSQFPSTYKTNPANVECNDSHRGRMNHFGFLQYTNINEAVSTNHHPEHAVAGSALQNTGEILARNKF